MKKRTNLIVDFSALKKVKNLLGLDSYSEAVNFALSEVLRHEKIRGLSDFVGKGVWTGNLSEMRDDKSSLNLKPKKRA